MMGFRGAENKSLRARRREKNERLLSAAKSGKRSSQLHQRKHSFCYLQRGNC